VQASSGVDVACLHVWIPADSRVTPNLPHSQRSAMTCITSRRIEQTRWTPPSSSKRGIWPAGSEVRWSGLCVLSKLVQV